ncbi:hypothetical protein D6029_02420 [Buttiauxella izardii]|uniref:Uncharacterized protein n=1 Tax=Buttiauxella izardii TaxID=82991 RepID=A0A3A5K973_9ENTR|nr:hypothetical protein D6029_02420 [Buttiauxella izardii]
MEPVVGFFTSYPIFLWITRCKILFIPGDQNGKRFFHNPDMIILSDKNDSKSVDCHSYPRHAKLFPHCG